METLPMFFEEKKVRRVRHDGEWWFAVEDVSGALRDHPDGTECWRQLCRSLEAEGCEVVTLCDALELSASDGTMLRTECVTLEVIFRIVQSVFSPRAEVFKRWLARVAAEPLTSRGYRTDLDAVFGLLGDAARVAIANRPDWQEGDGGEVARKAAWIDGKARWELARIGDESIPEHRLITGCDRQP